ncbi:hypothetical protein TWF696_000747 [Orbilia brochopaga]|uniref:Uncharacterized protein n=1 Tax=Orbilia brochopaga TaxID=3140254 RepID=A0AAV9VDS9_9PEZI
MSSLWLVDSQESSQQGSKPPVLNTINSSSSSADGASHNNPAAASSYPGAISDFYGLPSNPRCVFRTGDFWPRQWGDRRESRPVLNHPISEVWDSLGVTIYQHLDSLNILWTSIDPVRFGMREGAESTALHLWIAVVPGSLSLSDAQMAADGCKNILADAGFDDVEVAFRESLYRTSAGPQLLHLMPEPDLDDLQKPFSTALGLHIASREMPYFEGTAALYIKESSQSDRVLLLTARHVVFPPSVFKNETYVCKSTSKREHEILLLGSMGYEHALKKITDKIQDERSGIERDQGAIAQLCEDPEAHAHQKLLDSIAIRERAIKAAEDFYDDISRNWNQMSRRILGHVVYAPPIVYGCGPKKFTQDCALIELHLSKIDLDKFRGNVLFIDRSEQARYTKKMNPKQWLTSAGPITLKFPRWGLMQLKDVLQEQDFQTPIQQDKNGEGCLFVIKNGMGSGLTFGRLSGIPSFVRPDPHWKSKPSLEVGVYSCDCYPFSKIGDSGSIVADGLGRIVGMLTGSVGIRDIADVSYVTPYFWLEEQIKSVLPDSFLYPLKERTGH